MSIKNSIVGWLTFIFLIVFTLVIYQLGRYTAALDLVDAENTTTLADIQNESCIPLLRKYKLFQEREKRIPEHHRVKSLNDLKKQLKEENTEPLKPYFLIRDKVNDDYAEREKLYADLHKISRSLKKTQQHLEKHQPSKKNQDALKKQAQLNPLFDHMYQRIYTISENNNINVSNYTNITEFKELSLKEKVRKINNAHYSFFKTKNYLEQ